MFKKILIANRGEIAVRVIRACRELGIATVSLYQPEDISSLHVRLADECVMLETPPGRMDPNDIVRIAQDRDAEAIHPGYGFLAERSDFARACEEAGVVFIGPQADVIQVMTRKVEMLTRAGAAGIPTPEHSQSGFDSRDLELIRYAADDMGYPLLVRACRGGRGRGTRMVLKPGQLERAVRRARAEAMVVYGNSQLYLEKAIRPVYHVDVQLLADGFGNIVHLGERCSSLQQYNQKLIAETPAPCLTPEQRRQVLDLAIEIGRIFDYRNAGAAEFIVDSEGAIYFNDFKARIQVEHPITEMVTGIDIVREQLRIAAGEALAWRQEDIRIFGSAMQCRVNAEDPWNNFLPSPGHLRRFRLPSGPNLRIDTFAQTGCDIPVFFDSILAKLMVWGPDRGSCIQRMRGGLGEFVIQGIPTNLPLLQGILHHPAFVEGRYEIDYFRKSTLNEPAPETVLRDLSVIASIAYMRRTQAMEPTIPRQLLTGWHRSSRQL